ncbi:hypothetical protein HG530_001436 [Fusarium avenaceum]|nr:hypothetical protein HG530_001436 [Fusarium avenaceum]
MKDLLLGESKSRGTGDNTVVLIAPSLNLAHPLSSTIGAAFVISIDLARAGHVIQLFGDVLSDLSHLAESLVGEHVGSIPVDGSVTQEELLVEAVVEGVVPSISSACNGTILESASGIRV